MGEKMKCKNCGANIENPRGVCPVCGAAVAQDEGVSLDNIKYDSAKYDYAPVNKKKRFIIASIVIILIFAITSFAFFYVQNLKIPQPEMSFTTGQGIINDDEHIIYAFIDDSSHLEYIHGVNLYEGKIDENTIKISKPVLSDYQYTKSVDEGFRAIFFDLDELNLEEQGNYTYTFQMTFSFVGDENWYTYYETVNITGSTNLDVTKVIFDYSMLDSPNVNSTTASSDPLDFVYDGYWYTRPEQSQDKFTIYSLKFNKDGSCVITKYSKSGEMNWEVETEESTYTLEKEKLSVDFGNNHKESYVVDTKNKTIAVSGTSDKKALLTQRKNNTLKNAEDFFGV